MTLFSSFVSNKNNELIPIATLQTIAKSHNTLVDFILYLNKKYDVDNSKLAHNCLRDIYYKTHESFKNCN